MSAVASVRKELGVRTIFNVLGPLTNPAFAKRQILGVYNDGLVEVVANVLAALGADHAMVVHSRDGLDEISICAATHVCEVRGSDVKSYEVEPETFGLKRHRIEELAGGDVKTNARIAREILDGRDGAARDVVCANAGAALYVSGMVESLREGADMARDAIVTRKALRKLEELVAESNA